MSDMKWRSTSHLSRWAAEEQGTLTKPQQTDCINCINAHQTHCTIINITYLLAQKMQSLFLSQAIVLFQKTADLSVVLRNSGLAVCSANRGILIRILWTRNIFVTFPKTNTNNMTPQSNNPINIPLLSGWGARGTSFSDRINNPHRKRLAFTLWKSNRLAWVLHLSWCVKLESELSAKCNNLQG